MILTAERPFLGEIEEPVASLPPLKSSGVLYGARLLVVGLLDEERIVLDAGRGARVLVVCCGRNRHEAASSRDSKHTSGHERTHGCRYRNERRRLHALTRIICS